MSSGAALQLQSGSGITVNNILGLDGSGINNDGALRNISGSNTYTGAVNLTSAARINSDADTLYLTSGNITLGNNSLTVGGSANTVVGSLLSGNGGLIKDGAGTVTLLSDAVSFTGSTAVSVGVLNVQSGAALGTGTATVSSGAALQLQSGSGITVGNVLNLTGSGVNNDGAMRNISGSNTYSGLINVTSVSRINSDSGTLYLTTGGITLGNNTLTLGGSANTSINSILSGSGVLTKDGAGTVFFTGLNSFAGSISVSSGTLSVGDGTGGHDGSIASSSGISLNASTSLVYNLSSTASRTYSNVISGAGTLTLSGSGTLTLSASNSYTGGTTINGGTLAISSGNGLGASCSSIHYNTNVGSGAALYINIGAGASQIWDTFTGSGTIYAQDPSSGDDELLIYKLNGFTGLLDILASSSSNGRVNLYRIGGSSSPIQIENGATFSFNNSGTTYYPTTVTIMGAGNRNGDGALYLGNNTNLSGTVTLRDSYRRWQCQLYRQHLLQPGDSFGAKLSDFERSAQARERSLFGQPEWHDPESDSWRQLCGAGSQLSVHNYRWLQFNRLHYRNVCPGINHYGWKRYV